MSRNFRVATLSRAGHAPPLPRNISLLPRRGGVTPPRRENGRQPQNDKEGSRPLPTNNRMTSGYRQSTYFRQACRGRIYASRAVCLLVRITGTAATGGIYAAPTEYPLCCCSRKAAGGACPAPTKKGKTKRGLAAPRFWYQRLMS